MATWKELRALQAAARAAEAQRQTETARGQREARGLERTLGLVDQLIGLAPQAIEGYQAGEAQKILAGERGLEREKPKDDDILGQIGAFIASPFEEGVQRKAKMAAGRMAPSEVAKLQPLTTQAVQERLAAGDRPLDKPAQRKQVSPEEFERRLGQAMPAEASARGILEQSPALRLLPEREQQALAAGETQRVKAEQAAAEREQQLFDLKRKGLEAKPGVAKATSQKIGVFVDAGLPAVSKTAKEFRDQLNSDQPAIANQAADEIAASADKALEPFVARGDISVGSPEYEAAKGQIIRKATESEKKKTPEEKTIEPFLQDQSLIKNLVRLTDMRKKSKWNPSQERIIQQVALEGVDLFGFETIPLSLQGVIDRLDMTPAQQAYYKEALALKRQIMVELNGPGVLSNQDTNQLAQAAINPFSTNDEWNATSNAMLDRVRMSYNDRLDALGGIYAFPASINQFGDEIPQSVGDVADMDVPFGGTEPSEREAISQRAIEGTIKTAEPIIAALTSLAGQGVEKISDDALSSILKILKGQGAKTEAGPPPAAPAPAPTAQARPAPPPSEYEAPEIAYQRLKSSGQLDGPGAGRFMLIVTFSNGKTRYYPVADTPAAVESLTAKLMKIDPNVTTQRYTGNDAGGL